MARIVQFTKDQTPTQLAYLAGIVDGEGCFYFGKVKQGRYGNGTQWHCKLAVTSTDKALTDWLNDLFGGTKEQQYRYTSKKAFERPIHRWDASGLMLDYICPKILPFLIIKKRQCETMIEIRKTYANIGNQRLSDQVVEKRNEFLIIMHNLNSRFHSHPLKQH
jgi:hypothetical protein